MPLDGVSPDVAFAQFAEVGRVGAVMSVHERS